MCNDRVITFGVLNLSEKEIKNKRVLDVGSLDINGTLRPIIERFNPKEYIGIDIEPGPRVDMICNAEDMVERFGENSFDLVVATELLEHVKNWQLVISNIKRVCKPNGVILITTRRPEFPYHAFPDDYWRYGVKDFEKIFSDCDIEKLEEYPRLGICLKATKPNSFNEINLSDYQLYRVPFKAKLKFLVKEAMRKVIGDWY